MKTIKNIPASIRQRLLNTSKETNRTFNEVLQYYAMERFLYRLAISNYTNDFILKGALLLKIWDNVEFRPTKDIVLLGQTSNDQEEIKGIIHDIIQMPYDDDGIIFNANSVGTETIKEDADYEGVRVCFTANLDNARINMQLDIGFGDAITPAPSKKEYPTILQLPSPILLCYPPETVIAEKFEAMVKLDRLNSRMKDFFDICLLARRFSFAEQDLANAIKRTFTRRGTELPQTLTIFTEGFIKAKQPQWLAFRGRVKQENIPISFSDVISEIRNFLEPIIKIL